jgi:hypothetical protein
MDSGWAHLGTFGSYLTKLQPDFDSRLFGPWRLPGLHWANSYTGGA